MRKTLSAIFILLFAFALFLAFTSTSYSLEADHPAFLSMAPIFTTFKVPVNIPDHNLNALLHIETGIPSGETIYREDLKGLKDPLIFDGYGIENLEGIQYCSNVEVLSLKNNNLTSIVSLSPMNDLSALYLDGNQFSEVPNEYKFPYALQKLSMKNNPVASVPADIKLSNITELDLRSCALTSFPEEVIPSMISWLDISHNTIGTIPESIIDSTIADLYADGCGLAALPDEIYGLAGLDTLSVADNHISSLSKSIVQLVWLRALNLANNDLAVLPNEMSAMQKLQILVLDNNELTALPLQIGNAPLITLSARNNNIEAFPHSLCFSTKIDTIDFTLNFIKDLPVNFSASGFGYCGLQYNYLDVSPGSDTRSKIDGASGTVNYTPQIEPPGSIMAEAAPDAITISWDAPGWSEAGASMQPDTYHIYQADGSQSQLASLPASVQTYTDTGLSAETEYLYRIEVRYHITNESHDINTYRNASATIKAVTLALPSPSQSDTVPTPDAAASVLPEDIKQAAASPDVDNPAAGIPSPGQTADTMQNALPVWAVILICISASGLFATGVFFGWKILKKRQKNQDAFKKNP